MTATVELVILTFELLTSRLFHELKVICAAFKSIPCCYRACLFSS